MRNPASPRRTKPTVLRMAPLPLSSAVTIAATLPAGRRGGAAVRGCARCVSGHTLRGARRPSCAVAYRAPCESPPARPRRAARRGRAARRRDARGLPHRRHDERWPARPARGPRGLRRGHLLRPLRLPAPPRPRRRRAGRSHRPAGVRRAARGPRPARLLADPRRRRRRDPAPAAHRRRPGADDPDLRAGHRPRRVLPVVEHPHRGLLLRRPPLRRRPPRAGPAAAPRPARAPSSPAPRSPSVLLLALVPVGEVGEGLLVERWLPARWPNFAVGMLLAEVVLRPRGRVAVAGRRPSRATPWAASSWPAPPSSSRRRRSPGR